MKLVKRIVLVVVLLLIVAGVVLYFNLNSIIRRTVEQQTQASLNVPAKLGGASLSLFGGSLGLSDFELGSPSGFSAPQMFTLGGLKVEVSYGQLRGNPVHIQKIVLDNLKLVIEQANMKLNINALMDQPSAAPKDSSGQDKEPIKLIIDELQLNNATVAFKPGLPGLSNEISVPIGSLTLKNIGNAEGNQNGAAIKDVAMMTITSLAGKAGEVGKLPLDLTKSLSSALGPIAQKLGAGFQGQFKGISDAIGKNLGQNVQNVIGNVTGGKSPIPTSLPVDTKNAGDQLQNLLGGKKKP